MKALLVPAGLALVATGFAVGYGVGESSRTTSDAPAAPISESEVVVHTPAGERTLSVAEAAERIERLELAAVRRRTRPEAEVVETPPPTPAGDPPEPTLLRKDGTQYSPAELRDLARGSSDAALRLAAIRELRRDDSDESRTTLRMILDDKSASSDLRAEAAKSLATPPNRDKLSEELVTALGGEADPAVRRALAEGVGRMRDRDAWMPSIVALVHDEKDPEVRKSLLEAVVRDARDPAARAELLAIATNSGAPIDERRAAIAALPHGKSDADTVARVSELLGHPDARLRESAVAIVGFSQAITPAALAAALNDQDPGVRRVAVNVGAARLPQFANDKEVAKSDYQQLVETAVRIAASDPDASVRRTAVQQSGALPKSVRDQVLATGRQDSDLFVKVTSYARSPDDVARQGTPVFVGALDSPDAGLRDFAYRQLQRLTGLTTPYDARWNAKARADAIDKIRADLAASGR